MSRLRHIGFAWRVVIGLTLLLIVWALFPLVGSGSGHGAGGSVQWPIVNTT